MMILIVVMMMAYTCSLVAIELSTISKKGF